MADHPLLLDPATATRLEPHLDVAGKIVRALDALGPIADRDVVLVDGGSGRMAAGLARLGARLTVVGPSPVAAEAGPGGAAQAGGPAGLGLPEASADVILGCWSVYRGVDPVEMAEADRVLRPGGRLLVLHDYGRDDVSQLADPDLPEYASWSRRDGPFLQAGFRVRVVHAWWTFESIEEAGDILAASFGERGSALAASLKRPRLSWNVAVYHRDRTVS